MANKNNTTNTENKVDINNLTQEQKDAMLQVFMEQQTGQTETPREETPKVDETTTEAPPTTEEGTAVDKTLITKEQVEAAKKAAKELEKDYKVQENKTILGKLKKIGKWTLATAAVLGAGVAIGKLTNSDDLPVEEDDECDGRDAEFYDDNESEEE